MPVDQLMDDLDAWTPVPPTGTGARVLLAALATKERLCLDVPVCVCVSARVAVAHRPSKKSEPKMRVAIEIYRNDEVEKSEQANNATERGKRKH